MYAVIQTGGKQYRVRPGDLLVVEKLAGAVGDEIAFSSVLAIGEGAEVAIGKPTVEGALVNATLVETRKARKIKIFKKIRRQGYRRTRGHRQWESVLRVTALAAAGQTERWEGTVDLTPKAELDARARGLPAAKAEPAKKAEPRPAPVKKPAPTAKKAEPKKAEPAKKAAPAKKAPSAKAAPVKAAAAKPKAKAKPKPKPKPKPKEK